MAKCCQRLPCDLYLHMITMPMLIQVYATVIVPYAVETHRSYTPS
jgi:hypothetical protein